MNPQDLDLTYTVATVTHDAQITLLNDAIDGMAVINFIQMRPMVDGRPQADVVASVSFPNLVAYENFLKEMQSNLERHKKRQKQDKWIR